MIQENTWPAWALALATQRTPEDTGVGDTFNRILGTGGAMFKATMRALGMPCSCQRRQSDWNQLYSYTPDPAATALQTPEGTNTPPAPNNPAGVAANG